MHHGRHHSVVSVERLPYALTSSPGNIASPTAIAAQGDSFASNPVAECRAVYAQQFQGRRGTDTEAQPELLGGPAYLDEVKFVLIPARQPPMTP